MNKQIVLLITFDTAETKPMLSVAEIFTKIMTKQEKIQEAYGKYWEVVYEYVDKNGWCSAYWKTKTYFQTEFTSEKWRPKSLQGIENNNGWIRIESEADLPKEGMHHSILLDSECINGYRNYDVIVFYEVNSKFRKKEISHYQPIEKPKPPIY